MKADLYITSTGNISPQNTFGKAALPEELVEYNSVRLTCVEPEYKNFLDAKMIEQNEQLLTPTAFIQSTHNTIGAQIALLLGCNGYNNAFVHRGFSFESALLDAALLIRENEADNILVGAIDELTDRSFEILQRFGLYKKEPVSTLDLFKTKKK